VSTSTPREEQIEPNADCELGIIDAGQGFQVVVKANGLPSADALFFRSDSKIPRRGGTPVFTR
jgi:hypothetical protein